MVVGLFLAPVESDRVAKLPSFEKFVCRDSEEKDIRDLKDQNRNVEKHKAGHFGVEKAFPENDC